LTDAAAQLVHRNPVVRDLAQTIYSEHAFGLVPILADALEEAGDHDAAFVAHLRGPDPHMRGCWALDLLRGRVAGSAVERLDA
jgi:hypothetical protein